MASLSTGDLNQIAITLPGSTMNIRELLSSDLLTRLENRSNIELSRVGSSSFSNDETPVNVTITSRSASSGNGSASASGRVVVQNGTILISEVTSEGEVSERTIQVGGSPTNPTDWTSVDWNAISSNTNWSSIDLSPISIDRNAQTDSSQITVVNSGSGLVATVRNSTFTGSSGNDVVAILGGTNQITGAGGSDRFAFISPGTGITTIADFNVVDDKIQVSATGFGGGLQAPNPSDITITTIPLPAEQFRVGNSAVTASDRFLYDPATGTLSFDVDGSGSAAPVQFAQLSPNLALTSQNIDISR
jgi:aspartate carbamoyltransferase regulatory subunit